MKRRRTSTGESGAAGGVVLAFRGNAFALAFGEGFFDESKLKGTV